MGNFNPGDKVIKKNETDPRNYGEVMDIHPMCMKPGYVAVYFRRQVWMKPENLMHFDEWERKQSNKKRQVLNEYRVEGSFTYLQFCHTNYSNLEDCSSFEDCDGHETVKTVSVVMEAYSESEAAQKVIDEYRDDYTDACWMYGQPSAKFIRSELNLSTFWDRKASEQEAIRKLNG